MARNGNRTINLLTQNFTDVHPPLTSPEAEAAAAKCLFCYDAPCTRACPTHIDIPRFIRQILHKDTHGAAKTILDANIFGGSCARACPTQVLCEGACVDNTLLESPVQIGQLQRFACDTAHEASMDFYQPGPSTGKKIAVVGGGPSGLTCAHELRKRGHDVVVFDARALPGGLNTVGIAAYKINTPFALTEVERIKQIGLDIRTKRPVSGAEMIKLLAEYDAVYLAIGLGKTAALEIPGENALGVRESLEFITEMHVKPFAKCKLNGRVIVIGGGNTAIDAANAAVRLGASQVTIAYRRDVMAMPAFQHEYELAMSSGVDFMWMVAPTKIVTKAGRVTGVEFVRTKMSGAGRQAKLTVLKNSKFVAPADVVIKALGQEPLVDLLKSLPKLKISAKGRIEVNRETLATSIPKLFAGGDCRADSKEEIVNAVQDGKIAAVGIHRLLSN